MDEVVVSHGYDRDFGNLVKWGLEREDYGITVDAKMRTSQSGIFGAGDFITYGSGQAPNESSSISSLAYCFNKDFRQEATMFSLLAKGIEGLWHKTCMHILNCWVCLKPTPSLLPLIR
ncbi:hypothetical protein [Paenibacillus sp. RC84]|uniref:hypothetical protein n=1 Tax=Paenibacillus sp. RC84 TaxID=3156252 RepID=UPI003515E3BD